MATKNLKIDFSNLVAYTPASTFTATSNTGDASGTLTYNQLTHTGPGYDFTISDTATSITVSSTNGECINTTASITFGAVGITPTPTSTPPASQVPVSPTPTSTPPASQVPVSPTPTGTSAPPPSTTPTNTPTNTPTPTGTPFTTYHVFEDCTDGSFVAAAITAPINSSERYVDFNVSPQKYYAYTNNSVTDTTGYTVNNNLVPTSFDHTDQGCPPPQPSPTPVNNSWVITSGATNVSLTTGQASTNTNSFSVEVGTSPRTMKVKLNWITGTANANASVTIGGQTITVGPFTLPSTDERISTVSIPLNANTSYAGSVIVNGTSSGGTFAVLQATALIE